MNIFLLFRVDVDPEALRWSPVLSGPASLFGSPYKRDGGFFLGRSPPANSSPEKRSTVRKDTSSESSSEEEEDEEEKLKAAEKASKRKNKLESAKKNLSESLKKSADKRTKKGRKKKSDQEASSSGSDGNDKDENNEAKAATSDDDVVDEKVVNNKKNFGRKNQNSKKRSTKRSGEFEGLDGGTKSNIFSTTTTTTSRLHNSEEVDKKNGGDFSTKSKNVVVVKNSSEDAKRDSSEKGILNRAIGRLLQQRHRREVDDDADVEDEVDDKLSVVANGDKAKMSISFESPTKKLKKRSPDLTNRRLKRVAASKASDRIARESRGSINLDSTTSPSSSDSEADASKSSVKSKPSSKLDIFNRKFDRTKVVIQHSDSSDFEDEDATLASKFRKNSAGKRKSIDGKAEKKTGGNGVKPKQEDENFSGKKATANLASSKQIKPNQDPEKENQFNRSSESPAVTSNGKNLSWPEQLARSKAARSISTEKQRQMSLEESADSADTAEIRSDKDLAEPVTKKAIILPILGKHRKEALLKAAEMEKPATVKPLPVATTPDSIVKKRGPGRPRKLAPPTPRLVGGDLLFC